MSRGNKPGLDDLKNVMQQLKEQQAARRQAALQAQAKARAQARQQQAQQRLFTQTVGPVKPLKASVTTNTHHGLRGIPPSPIPLQQLRDEQAALQESLSDDFDVSTLLDTDAELSFAQPGIGNDVVIKLRRGHWSLQGEVDLHGLRTDEARAALSQFLSFACKRGWRCVRVIHGKGLGSPGRMPVLKQKVLRWLVQKHEVLAFVQSPAPQGGAGALLVLLKGSL